MDYSPQPQGANGIAPYPTANLGNSLNSNSNTSGSWMNSLMQILGGMAPMLGAGASALGLGGLTGLLGKGTSMGQVFGGQPEQMKQFQRFNPEQQSAFSSILKQALSGQGLGQGMDFAPIEQNARTQFSQQTVPGLAERFTQMGGSDTRLGSSGFGQALSSAGAGLEQGLAAQKSQYGMDQQRMLMSLLGLGLTPQTENAYQQRQPGMFESGAQGLMSSLPLLGLLGK